MATHLTSSDAEKLKQLEGRVDKLEIRVSQIEDPMQVILENVLELSRVTDEMRETLHSHSLILQRTAARLDRIEGTLGAIESRLDIDKR